MSENDEKVNEIVYDDPGTVTDIRKMFGERTKPAFARPRPLSGHGSINKSRSDSRGSRGSIGSFGSIDEKTSSTKEEQAPPVQSKNSEIVYDDPGSVTALRKRLNEQAKLEKKQLNAGVTKPQVARPPPPMARKFVFKKETPSVSEPLPSPPVSPEPEITAPNPVTPPQESVPQKPATPPRTIVPAPEIVVQPSTPKSPKHTNSVQIKAPPPLPQTPRLEQEPVFTPRIPATPKSSSSSFQYSTQGRRPSSASSMFIFPEKENDAVLKLIGAIEDNPNMIDSFEAAVRDFYENVQKLDSSITDSRR